MIFKEDHEKYLKENSSSCLISIENNLITSPSGNNGARAVPLESHAQWSIGSASRNFRGNLEKKKWLLRTGLVNESNILYLVPEGQQCFPSAQQMASGIGQQSYFSVGVLQQVSPFMHIEPSMHSMRSPITIQGKEKKRWLKKKKILTWTQCKKWLLDLYSFV